MRLLTRFFKRSTSLLIMVLIVDSVSAQFRPSLYTFQLRNGLKVWVNADTTFNEVALYLFVDAGFKKEAPGQYGIAHVFEHAMLPTRIGHNPDFMKEAAQLRVNSNAQIFNDYVRYYLQYNKNGLDYGLIALADRLDYQMDSLSLESLQRHINNVNSEIARQESFGSFRWRPLFREALAKGLFGVTHPYGHEQSLPDIQRISKKDLEYWFKRWYGAANATLVLLGNVDTTIIRNKVETYFGAIDPGSTSLTMHTSIRTQPVANEVDLSLNQDHHITYYSWVVPGYGTPDNDGLQLVPLLIGETTNSLLTRELAAAGIKNAKPLSNLETYQDASVFDIGIVFSDEEDKERVDRVLQSALWKLRNTPFPTDQLQAAAAAYELSLLKGMEDIDLNSTRIEEIGAGALFLDDPLYFQKRLQTQKRITPERLRQIITKWLGAEPFKVFIRGEQCQVSTKPYDFKKNLPFHAPSTPAAPSLIKKEINGHVTVYSVTQKRVPIVDFLVVFQSNRALGERNIIRYKKNVQQYFEAPSGFSSLLQLGVQTDVLVRDQALVYKVSTTTSQVPSVFKWLTNSLRQLEKIKRDSAVWESPFLDQTLSVLKNRASGSPENGTPDYFPVKHVFLLVVGDINAATLDFSSGTLSLAKTRFEPPANALTHSLDTASIVIKSIGESSTSYFTLAHAIQPTTSKEEVCQQLLLHLLREKLMSNLREKNSLVYEVYPYSSVPAGREVMAYWQTTAAIEKTVGIVQQMYLELDSLQADLSRLPVMKSRVLADWQARYKSLSALENGILQDIDYGYEEDHFKSRLQALEMVTAEELHEFITKNATPKSFKLAVFTSPKQVSSLAAKLGSTTVVQ